MKRVLRVESLVLGDLVQAELNQMVGLKLAAGPAISVLKLNSEHIVRFSELAVHDSGLTAVIRKLKSDDCVR